MNLLRFIRHLRRRFSRGRRLERSIRRLGRRELPANKWDMTEAEEWDFEWHHARFVRDFNRLNRLATRWGYRPA